MTSLTEVYDGNGRGVSRRRLYAGSGLVLCGAVLAVVAVLVATTDLFADFVVGFADWGMAEQFTVVRVAGVLAGMGVPAALVGVFIVLPAGRRVRAAAAISASLCLLGVVLFWHAYPENWRYGENTLTLEVSAIYLLGLFTAVWCLFTAVVNFKTRNDPGGMLEMNVTRRNQTIVEVNEDEGSSGGLGGIGFLGGTPDGDVETQTNAADGGGEADDDGTTLSFDEPSGAGQSTGGAGSPMAGAGTTPTSDGGTAASDISSPLDGGAATEASAEQFDAEIVESAGTGLNASTGATDSSSDDHADRYCGNCRHFEYVRSADGMVPYCARHDAAMDDMDACDEWTPNRREK
ncbi:DUF7139 domain-containing protein [Halopiger xanaduensis]|uniref:Uncharacterized protein n=1 Tax=Halopiger xanaduensis (strain DSM 18323 / JCM 14033 / SH-6) TaxID=797210 RepID=F8D4F2_HALXS|nr:hypothetical protein [Halopiger xanaduensis]AEH38696.1 hypothetical protein Halxa_4091 [Halopiger xanaduensis SH-6]